MGNIHRAAADGFALGAATYARGRPDYPPAAHTWLRDELGLRAGSLALDLGAGTGKFTTLLLATGARVIALEPVEAMRAQLAQRAPAAEPLAGDAEHIPLPDGSVDAAVGAQSFHWFATPTAIAEIRRVLKPGGRLGLIWNVRDSSMEWVARLTRIIAPHEGDAPRFESGAWRGLFPAPGFGPLHEQRCTHGHTGPPERVIVDRVLSISFIAALDPAQKDAVAREVRKLIATTPALAGRSEVTFPYVTSMFRCTKIS